MFDMDGDGDIDEFDEELIEYGLQLMEDEMFAEEVESERYQESVHKDDLGQSSVYWILIALGLIIIGFIVLMFMKN